MSASIDHVHAIVLCYNSADLLDSCLSALQDASERRRVEIICVDNASTDGTRDHLEALAERGTIEAIYSDRNLGYAGGNNLAIQELLRRKTQAPILIVNPDAQAERGTLDRLVEVLERRPEVGLVGPVIASATGERPSRPGRPLFALHRPPLLPDERTAAFTDSLGGSFLLVRPQVFQDVGLIDEGYFLYWEELDFCYRARAQGWRCQLCLDVAVIHRPGTAERCHRIYYLWRNQVRFVRKNVRFGLRGVYLGRRLLSPGLRWLVNYSAHRRWDLFAAATSGLWHGLTGESGKSEERWADPARPRQYLRQS